MKKTFNINNLDCQNCANKVEINLNKKKFANNIIIDYMSGKIIIENEIIDDNLIKKIEDYINTIEDGITITETGHTKIKYKGHVKNTSNHEVISENKIKPKFKINKKALNICSILFFIVGLIFKENTFSFVPFLISYLCIGYDILYKCFKNLRNKELFDENFLMTIATIGAFAIKEYPEAIFVLAFYKMGEYLQDKAVEKSRKSIIDLVKIKEDTVCVEKKSGEYEDIKAEDVSIGDIFIVRPGNMILIDGIIVEGKTNIDSSALTGESDEILKVCGDEVLSGVLNKKNVIKVKATKEFKNSTISRILDVVENASANKSKTEQFITRFSKIYTPIVCLCAVLILLIPTLILGLDFSVWLYRALSFLVVSCPCALVISVPLSYFGGIGLASKNGILVKGSNYLDLVPKIDNYVFDKTGTLTQGNFTLKKRILLKYFDENYIGSIACSLEQNSTHPIAKSILKYFESKKMNILKVSDLENLTGIGIKGIIDKKKYYLGSYKLADIIDIKNINDINKEKNYIYLVEEDEIIAKFLIDDNIKPESLETVSYLKEHNKKTYMLTGDNKSNAKYVANNLGIEFLSDLMPEDKLNFVKNLEGKTLFVGDGLNDAPVLAISDIGIAMGDIGNDSAIEISDIVLNNGKIGSLIKLDKIANYTKKIVIENISFALMVKLLVLILISLGLSSMFLAIFADVGVSFICILNSLRLLKTKIR